MQSAKNICAPLGNSPQEMVLSTGRHFATTQILIKFICIGLLFLLFPIIYYLPMAFPTRSADFCIFILNDYEKIGAKTFKQKINTLLQTNYLSLSLS